MDKNYNRLKRLEKQIQALLNPEDSRIVPVIVDKRIGETTEEKIFDLEKQLGRKLKRSNILLVEVTTYSSK